MTKHTPGPWHAHHTAGHDKHGQSAVYGDDGHDIAIVYDGAANASLLAAAPDLLAACLAAESWLSEYETGGPDAGLEGLLTDLRDAIAKAKGELV